jgi:hypothetical protein
MRVCWRANPDNDEHYLRNSTTIGAYWRMRGLTRI